MPHRYVYWVILLGHLLGHWANRVWHCFEQAGSIKSVSVLVTPVVRASSSASHSKHSIIAETPNRVVSSAILQNILCSLTTSSYLSSIPTHSFSLSVVVSSNVEADSLAIGRPRVMTGQAIGLGYTNKKILTAC